MLYWTPIFTFLNLIEWWDSNLRIVGLDTELIYIFEIKNKQYLLKIVDGKKEVVVNFRQQDAFNDFLNVFFFFKQLYFAGYEYRFLRYDELLQFDFAELVAKYPKLGITNDKIVEIYDSLGIFFFLLFYASFDMSPKTKVEVEIVEIKKIWCMKEFN